MFERHIEEQLVLLTEQTIGGAESILLRDILQSSMPDALKRFFELEVDRWLEAERDRLFLSPHFDYSQDDVAYELDRICLSARPYARFTRTDFTETLDKSIKLWFNYICRPQWTISRYIFHDALNVDADQILDLMAHFNEYGYYRVVVEDYFRTKAVKVIGKEKFEELLSLIDSELVRNYDSSKFARLAAPVFQLFEPDADLEFARAPVEALSIFYDDKGLASLVKSLDQERPITPSLSLQDLIKLISDAELTTTLEIGELVTRHFTDNQSRHDQPDDEAAQFHLPENEEAILNAEVSGFYESESFSNTEILSEETESPGDFHIEKEQTEVMSGEQETPDFIDLDEEEPDTLPSKHQDVSMNGTLATGHDFDIPTDVLEVGTIDSMSEKKEVFPFPEDIRISDEETNADTFPIAENEPERIETTKADIDIPNIAFVEEPSENAYSNEQTSSQDESEYDITSTLEDVEDAGEEHVDPQKLLAQYGDLRNLISSGNRKKYIKKLFGKDESMYEATIDKLNAAPSWRQASEEIDEVFLTNSIDIYSRLAVGFTDEIYKRYLKKTS